ncbi:MAG TPA: hypothetical protein VMS93_00170, partial [Candidatus Saccharimonadales bacterium]|nr:hypothetical protein [Candidatus Saccharimonadales bacterium]
MAMAEVPLAQAVPLADAPLLGRLYSEWLAGDRELAALLSPSFDPSTWAAPAGPADAAARGALWRAVLEQNRRLGAAPAALALGEALAAGSADAVV